MTTIPSLHANRGKWFEDLLITICGVYRRRGDAAIQKVAVPKYVTRRGHVGRKRSTVDFVGVAQGIAVAFDAKNCRQNAIKQTSYGKDTVKQHQTWWLLDTIRAGGCGFLLICFERQAKETYAVLPQWWERQLIGRQQIHIDRFRDGAVDGSGDCVRVVEGPGVFRDFIAAVPLLHAAARNGWVPNHTVGATHG